MPVVNDFGPFVISNKIKKILIFFFFSFPCPGKQPLLLFNALCCISPDLIKTDPDKIQFCLPPRFFTSSSTSVEITAPIYWQKKWHFWFFSCLLYNRFHFLVILLSNMPKMKVVFQGFCLYSWTSKAFLLEIAEKTYWLVCLICLF